MSDDELASGVADDGVDAPAEEEDGGEATGIDGMILDEI